MLECKDGACDVELRVSGSEESPIVNPAFVIKGWGKSSANLALNGKKVEQGRAFRAGRRQGLDTCDLIVWLRYESAEPVKISLSPEAEG